MTLSDKDRQILIEHYRDKSHKAIKNVHFLLENDELFLAVNQIYYGIYYMLSAIAVKNHFKTSKHLQLIGWFNKTFVKGGCIDARYSKVIRHAYENRMKGDYDVFSTFTREKVEESVEEMKEVIAKIEELL